MFHKWDSETIPTQLLTNTIRKNVDVQQHVKSELETMFESGQ